MSIDKADTPNGPETKKRLPGWSPLDAVRDIATMLNNRWAFLALALSVGVFICTKSLLGAMSSGNMWTYWTVLIVQTYVTPWNRVRSKEDFFKKDFPLRLVFALLLGIIVGIVVFKLSTTSI